MTPLKTILEISRDRRASAAAEMALIMPLLFILMFGSFELGNFFYDEHIVVKAVRDGARFAGRQSFTDYAGCSPSSGMIDNVRNVTRTGQLFAGGTPRLGFWSDPATVTVTVTCSGGYGGIYNGLSMGAPVVTVAAAVPYPSLFGSLGIDTTGFTLNAQSQAAVMGL